MRSGLKRIALLATLAALFSGVPDVNAQIKTNALTITPYIAGHVFEGNQGMKNAPEYGLSFGYNFNKKWAAELSGSFYEMEELVSGGQTYDVVAARVDALYHFQPEEKIVPYFVFGLGAVSMELDTAPNDATNEDLTLNYGFGLKLFTTDWLAIRADVRHFLRFDISDGSTKYNNNYYNDLMVSGGFAFQLGGVESQSAKVVDADDDGIVDSRDRCLDTPPGYAVDSTGCPLDTDADGVVDAEDLCADTAAGAEVDANGCAVVVSDDDGDGVLNISDKCPNTPANVPVNSYGCPSDSDGDTVFDVEDDCPNTPAGTAVGPDGCGPDEVNIKARYEDDAAKADAFRSAHPEGAALAALAGQESLQLDIAFAANRSVISPEYNDELKQAAAFIAAHPDVKILVEGHTDSTGATSLNQKLSQKRADTVRWILVRDYGVDPKRITARGYGESQPVADNSTQAGREKNRRVLVKAVTE